MNLSLEYIAGFFDGEGCITSQLQYITGKYEKYPRVSVQITITQKSTIVLNEIQKMYGGTVRLKGSGCSVLNITGKDKMHKFLTDITPYLVEKKEQAEIALEFVNSIRTENLGCVALDKDIHEKRELIHRRLKLLKVA
jgi:hypothetical protein